MQTTLLLHSHCFTVEHVKEAELTCLWSVFSPTENQECLQHVVDERLTELVRVLKAFIGKHQALNSAEILSAAGTVIAKVKGERSPLATSTFKNLRSAAKDSCLLLIKCHGFTQFDTCGSVSVVDHEHWVNTRLKLRGSSYTVLKA